MINPTELRIGNYLRFSEEGIKYLKHSEEGIKFNEAHQQLFTGLFRVIAINRDTVTVEHDQGGPHISVDVNGLLLEPV